MSSGITFMNKQEALEYMKHKESEGYKTSLLSLKGNWKVTVSRGIAQKPKKAIMYHGTSQEDAAKILKSGFEAKTYFARHLEDAIGYGGSHVFEVAMPEELNQDKWQIIASKKVPKERIISLINYKPQSKYTNKIERLKVLLSNMSKQEIEYGLEDMKKHPEKYPGKEIKLFEEAAQGGGK